MHNERVTKLKDRFVKHYALCEVIWGQRIQVKVNVDTVLKCLVQELRIPTIYIPPRLKLETRLLQGSNNLNFCTQKSHTHTHARIHVSSDHDASSRSISLLYFGYGKAKKMAKCIAVLNIFRDDSRQDHV